MVTHIVTAWPLPCNKTSNTISSTSFIKKSNNCPICSRSHAGQTSKNDLILTTKSSSNHTNSNECLSFYSAKKIIHQFLSRDRIVLLPHTTPKFTESELAAKLNVSIAELRYLQSSPRFYRRMAKQICLLLVNLYCSTVFQKPKLIHVEGSTNE